MFRYKDSNIIMVVLFIIVSIMLVTVIHQTYKKYIMEEMLTNGRILCNQVMNAQLSYYSEHGKYLIIKKASFNKDLSFDARTNPYFFIFSTYPLEGDKQGITVFGSDKMQDYEIYLTFDGLKDKPKSIKNLKMKVIKKKK